ncbi:MAG TPA: hypothetical protein VHZ76_01755 [Gammaproteobacteria bacterium]|nr:hypothetical protein [Gammaproteobacteria bacterium]
MLSNKYNLENHIVKQSSECKEKIVAHISGLNGQILNFNNDECMFLVSVGTQPFESASLSAQLEVLKKFKTCTILVGDTLQKYNIFLDYSINAEISMEQAEKIAWQRGTEWVERYKTEFDTQLVEYSIQRWDEWKENIGFVKALSDVKNLLLKDKSYQEAMSQSIAEYRERYHKKVGDALFNMVKHKFDDACQQYLIEECAVMLLIARCSYCRYALYPAKQTAILAINDAMLIRPYYPSSMIWLPIRLRKKKNVYSLSYN